MSPADNDLAGAGNELAGAISPYLRQHADNPVHWKQWTSEALAEAARRDVPILLSIGYAACHWCHVMAHESFEDEGVAAAMNEFVCIKVDREERPDLDAVYMNATVAMTGHGGWPMTCFLTPDGRPFFCGTYFPKPQFLQLLAAVLHVGAGQYRGDRIAGHREKQEGAGRRHHEQVQQQLRDRDRRRLLQAVAQDRGVADAGGGPEQGDVGRGAQVKHCDDRPGEIQPGQQCPP